MRLSLGSYSHIYTIGRAPDRALAGVTDSDLDMISTPAGDILLDER